MSSPKVIGLIIGSFRTGCNSTGVASWAKYYLKKVYPNADIKVFTPISPFNLMAEPIDPVVPMKIQSPDDYVNPIVRKWAWSMKKCDAYVIITPEYNHSYSGHLKVMFDHVYNEFRGKPVTLLTFSGHGAKKAYTQLTDLVEKFSMTVTGGIHFTIPMSYVSGSLRISNDFHPDQAKEDTFMKELTPTLVDNYKKMSQVLYSEL